MVSFDDTQDSHAEAQFEGLFSSLHLHESARAATVRTRNWLTSEQDAAGFWCGELEGDCILESEYILLLAWLGQEETDVAKKCAAYLLKQQLATGGWAMYPGGELEISGSVKAYFALKLTGQDPQSEPMRRARTAILAHGGADAVNSFTRFYLALLGQISYEHCPAVPPEMVLLPDWSPVNIYRISSWSRTIFVPLSIMWAFRPVRRLEPRKGIHELFLTDPEKWPELRSPGATESRGLVTWERFFRGVDKTLKFCERRGIKPLRGRALRAAEKWMTLRFTDSDGLGAIFPPIVWSIVALKCLGYADDSAEMRYCHEQLNGLMIEENDTIRLQPCKSPVWDTALTLRALAAAGVERREPSVGRGVDWLLGKEVTRPGDWSHTVTAQPAGWYFEYHNEFYPDVDDTIMVLMALRHQFDEHLPPVLREQVFRSAKRSWFGRRAKAVETRQQTSSISVVSQDKIQSLAQMREQVARFDRSASACDRAFRWILAMQNRDGGWGAFDRNNDKEFLCHVPFADHNAMIDPSTPDITGRVLEMLGQYGMTMGDAPVERAIRFLRRTQESDGSWPGRWGVNYIYGTWQVLVGLRQVGMPVTDSLIVNGADWLLNHQQRDGGWGESADSYCEPLLKGRGPSTASQTAWALLGLLAAGKKNDLAVSRGVKWLVEHQRSDGTWDEPEFTGTGFPRVFYLRYHMYPIYFPLLALGQWLGNSPWRGGGYVA